MTCTFAFFPGIVTPQPGGDNPASASYTRFLRGGTAVSEAAWKLFGRLSTAIARRTARPITLGRIFGLAITLGALAAVTLGPAWNSLAGSWFDLSTWKAVLAVSWPALCGAIVLKYSEKFKSFRAIGRARRHSWVRRRLVIARAISRLEACNDCQSAKDCAADVKSVRQDVLECVVLTMRDWLSIPEDERLIACEVDYAGPQFLEKRNNHMYVSACSHSEFSGDRRHPRPDLIAEEAIKKSDIVVIHDMASQERWKVLSDRGYRSVVAIPISRHDLVYGALVVDSSRPFAFVGRTEEIMVLLQPFLAVLSLTYPIDCASKEA